MTAPAALLPLATRRVLAGPERRTLSFRHTHTGEELTVVYWTDGAYVPEALAQINRLLRDFRTGEVRPIDPELLDLLHELARRVESEGAYEVISGYRSPRTNASLRRRSGGVAEKSLHLQGRAIDVRLTDVDSAKLRDLALEMKRGGVGYYPESDFVHVDTGRVRTW